jgi:chromosome partition protein MukE
MTRGAPVFSDLAAVIEAEEFPEVDLALRRGRHIDREDGAWYAFLTDAQDQLEALYRRYGCELVHRSDGYFYLLPSGDKLPRRQLAAGDMLVGQALALLYLDPSTVQQGGIVERDEVLAQLDGILGSDALIRAFNPKRKRYDERVAQETVRKRVAEATRRLAGLGFIDVADGDRLRLRSPLLRFAEPARGVGSPAEALAKLVAQGEVVMIEGEADPDRDPEDEAGT